jgi:hypothetical protein
MQHFLFLVSVFLFGERDLLRRARIQRKKVITGVQERHSQSRKTFFVSAEFFPSTIITQFFHPDNTKISATAAAYYF